jgi:head-tail adaptor
MPIAHELNERITFQNVSGSYSAATRESSAATDYRTVWAKVTQAPGGDISPGDQRRLTQTTVWEIWCRYDRGVTGYMQIKWGSRVLTITEPPRLVTDANNREWMTIHAEETSEQLQ